MQRKIVFALIFLGFSISMELVLALHILTGPGNKNSSSAQSAKPTLVSTIALSSAQNSPSDENAPVDPGLAGQNSADPNSDPSIMDPGQGDGFTDPFSADPAYPAPSDEDPMLDGDHQPGSEPPDSAFPSDPLPPDDTVGHPGGFDPVYPPPIDEPQEPIPAEPTEALPSPSATLQLNPNPSNTAPAPSSTSPAASATPAQTPSSVPPTQTRPSNSAPEANQLLSVRAPAAPKIDGNGGDPAWANAPAFTIKTSGGANNSATQVSIRSMYDGENIYFFLTWADPTRSFLLNPWEKQKDGSWKMLYASTDKLGGDENQYYMDKIAIMWPIANSLPDFSARGCAVACHSGAEPDVKSTGLMYTGGSGQAADIWQLKSVLNLGQLDDDYLDNTHYSSDTPWAGFKSDPGKAGYTSNRNKSHDAPAYMPPGGGDKSGAPGYILDSNKVKFDPGLYQPGDRLPAFLVGPFQGDRADIQAGWTYKNGTWTLELKRRLVTGSSYDIQFDDLNKTYPFALATFDNSHIRHAVQNGATVLKFKK